MFCLFSNKRARRTFVALLISALIFGVALWLATEAYAEIEFRLAQQAIDHYDLDDALAHLRKCLQLRPNRFSYSFLAARTARRAGHFRQAYEYLDRCEDLASDGANVSLLERALLRAQEGEVLNVDRPLWAAVKQNHPEKALILEALAQGYIRIGYYPLAARCLEPLLEDKPDHAEAWLWRAAVFELTGNRPDTVTFYRKAVELRPDRPRYRLRLACYFLNVNALQEARPLLEQLCATEPDDPEALVGMGRLEAETGHRHEAATLLSRALDIQPNHAQALMESAKLAFRNGALNRTEEYLRKTLALDATDRAANYLLYQCLEKAGKRDQAARQLARFNTLQKDLQRLEKILRTELPQHPNRADLYAELGDIFARNGRPDMSRPWKQQALRLAN